VVPRVGIDLVAVESIRESLTAHGERFLARVFSDREIAECRIAAELSPARLASRFAAKEATFKALHVGDEAVAWLDVEATGDPNHPDKLILNGRAADIATRAGIASLSVSVTHRRGAALAVVITDGEIR
jgi:holo-[acyl-carrier protein] synthase